MSHKLILCQILKRVFFDQGKLKVEVSKEKKCSIFGNDYAILVR